MEHLLVEVTNRVATVTLNRAAVHNAFLPAMIRELHDLFARLATDAAVRVVVLTGAGRSFCAGVDLQWMQESLDWSEEKNVADAQQLAAMYRQINTLPKPVIGRINGAAVGGGAGLVACCDFAVATEEARFGFSEVKLGLVPAVISQFVVPKIGVGRARAWFVAGSRFGALEAYHMGLVQRVVASADLDGAVEAACADMLTSAPGGVRESKQLVQALIQLDEEAASRYTVETIARVRTGTEAQSGMRAFLEKRRPPWQDS
ncbi:MAG: enoyl-CoA hydratase-related protein [Herpetosiphon sp.]